MDVSMNQHTKLTAEEKKMLKQEVYDSWSELPKDLRAYILESKRQKMKVLYMLQDWAKQNGRETMLDLLSRKIVHKEEKMQKLEEMEKNS
ncbi:MAG: hypothetical protein IJ440_04155 [Alphaproteobacteria bacterium]|nr:hypothetical protein [Alphaproteobacteria bacterium]